MHINMNGRSHKKHSGRTRDLLSSQPGVNGKGDADRTIDTDKFRENYDQIDWGRNRNAGGATDNQTACCEAEECCQSGCDCEAERQPAALQSGGADGNTVHAGIFDGGIGRFVRTEGESESNASQFRILSPLPKAKHSDTAPDCGQSPRKSCV